MTAGLGRKLTPDFLIGLVTGYEHFKYDVAALAGTLKGDGGTVGGYAAWRFTRQLRWDAGTGLVGHCLYCDSRHCDWVIHRPPLARFHRIDWQLQRGRVYPGAFEQGLRAVGAAKGVN